jgi:hypothetical protein
MQNTLTVSYGSTSIAKQTVLEISLKKVLLNSGVINDTLQIDNNSANFSSIKIPITINITALKITPSKTNILATNDSAILSVNTTGNISWNTGGTSNPLIVKNAGTYFATVTDSNGCHHTDTVTINKSGTGINISNGFGFTVYPNPTGEFLFVRNSDNMDLRFVLINSLGETIIETRAIAGETIRIDLQNFARGIYYVKNEKGQGIKIIVNH